MPVAVRSERVRELVDENAEVEQVATGFTFTEGPIWMPDGSLHFSDMPGDKRRRWHPDEGVTVLLDLSRKCNGMTRDNDGNVIVCEHVTSSVVRESPDGTPRHARLPLAGQVAEQPQRRDRRLRRVDHLHRPDLRTDARVRHRARAGARLPGRVPHPAGGGRRPASCWSTTSSSRTACASRPTSRCSTSTTPTAPTSASSTSATDHQLSNGRVFAENIGDGDLAKGGLVDGMKLDERGNVYVTGPDGVWVFAPDGEHLGVIEVPESVGNVNWGGDDWRTSSSRRRRPCTACG